MTRTGRRQSCGNACNKRPHAAPATLKPAASAARHPRRPILRFAWLGVSSCAFCLYSKAEAFVQPSFGSVGGAELQRAGRKRTQGTCLMSERRGLWPQRPAIDLRSDTVTQPTAGMRKAMHKAEVGDDVLGEDPTVKKLEAETADILGKEAALFVPSGTMANLICSLVWCSQRGSEMILGDQSHSFLWEQANAAQFGGIGYRPLPNLPDGTMDLNAIEAAVRRNNPCFPVSRLVTVENTHAQCGGKVLPIEYLDDLAKLAQEEGLRVHMDGARLWNAAASSGLPLSRITAGVDSVAVCYSKGLGAPVGSAVAGSADFISRATRVRKALGGGMRQSGVVAAAALEGLRKQLPRVGEDHTNAKRLAQGLYDLGMPGAVDVDPSSVHTNIVMVTVGPDLTDEGMTAAVVCDRLREKGVLAMAIMHGTIRFVTHSQVSTTDVQRALAMMKEVLEEAGLRPAGPNRTTRLPTAEAAAAAGTDELDWRSTNRLEAVEATAEEYLLNNSVNHVNNVNHVNHVSGDNASQLQEGDTGRDPHDAIGGAAPRSDAAGAGAADASESSLAADGASTAVVSGLSGEVGSEVSSGLRVGGGVDGGDGVGVANENGFAENMDEESPFLEEFEEVELQGMAVSNEGFVAIMASKESTRALKLVVTPDDPMSGGLDVEQAETSEARTLLQLMQGIDVARHLPNDALGNLMDLSMSSGVQLSTVYVSRVKPFSAMLMARVPQRDSETGPLPAPATAVTPSTSTDMTPSATATATPSPAEVSPQDEWIDGGAAAAAAAAAAATAADNKALQERGEAVAQRESPVSSPVSPSVPGTTMGSGYGRPRLGVSKIAETANSFEALGLALRYPSTKIFVRADLLTVNGKADASMSSFDAADVAELYPNLMRLKDARARRSAADEMDAQFEVQKIRQQLESAMNAGDSDRISALREELNSLVMPNASAAPVN